MGGHALIALGLALALVGCAGHYIPCPNRVRVWRAGAKVKFIFVRRAADCQPSWREEDTDELRVPTDPPPASEPAPVPQPEG